MALVKKNMSGNKPARKRDSTATRAAILKAARRHFIAEGYDGLGLRQIAADAGIDVALVGRYFGSKEKLFAEVLRQEFNPTALAVGNRMTLGRRLIEALYRPNPRHEALEHFQLIVRALTVPTRVASLRTVVNMQFLHPLAKWLGGKDALVRASLLLTYLTGAALQSAEAGPLSLAQARRFKGVMAVALQALVDGSSNGKIKRASPAKRS